MVAAGLLFCVSKDERVWTGMEIVQAATSWWLACMVVVVVGLGSVGGAEEAERMMWRRGRDWGGGGHDDMTWRCVGFSKSNIPRACFLVDRAETGSAAVR